MTVEIDAGTVGTISCVLRQSAEEKGLTAISYINDGNPETAEFYARWAARHASAMMEIDKDWSEL